MFYVLGRDCPSMAWDAQLSCISFSCLVSLVWCVSLQPKKKRRGGTRVLPDLVPSFVGVGHGGVACLQLLVTYPRGSCGCHALYSIQCEAGSILFVHEQACRDSIAIVRLVWRCATCRVCVFSRICVTKRRGNHMRSDQ